MLRTINIQPGQGRAAARPVWHIFGLAVELHHAAVYFSLRLAGTSKDYLNKYRQEIGS
jgi:hypothetical protein